MKATLEKYLEKKAAIAKLEAETKTLRDEILAALGEGTHSIDGFVATVETSERLSLDTGAIAEAFGEEALAPFAKLTSYPMLTVKKAK